MNVLMKAVEHWYHDEDVPGTSVELWRTSSSGQVHHGLEFEVENIWTMSGAPTSLCD
jgi:hypothetical protein